MHNFIQSYETIKDIYDKIQLDLEYLLIYILYQNKRIKQAIFTNVNITRKDEREIY